MADEGSDIFSDNRHRLQHGDRLVGDETALETVLVVNILQIAITSRTLPEDREERQPGHSSGLLPPPCPENFQKSRSEYSIEKGIE